ncbi:hypothetical protein LNV09_04320 [Paucibacter sp. B2R-40]|uniref:hypothetical protein n=1 Tax=Paucibacter sp. B2R-40 TaxID=2893554 RepID=UPI0021E36CAE|nr:hypothetical protein [Paucibacter sp. B2R-40]MCV2353380.1 hypothetical protein [Paucibacter sp. B2R-40]
MFLETVFVDFDGLSISISLNIIPPMEISASAEIPAEKERLAMKFNWKINWQGLDELALGQLSMGGHIDGQLAGQLAGHLGVQRSERPAQAVQQAATPAISSAFASLHKQCHDQALPRANGAACASG